MISKRLFQTKSVLVLTLATVGIYFIFTTPLLRFAAQGNISHVPTQIAVFSIRMYAYCVLFGVLGVGIYYISQFKLVGVFFTLYVSIFILDFGIGMKMGFAIFAFMMVAIFIFTLLIRHRWRPAILSIQSRYKEET